MVDKHEHTSDSNSASLDWALHALAQLPGMNDLRADLGFIEQNYEDSEDPELKALIMSEQEVQPVDLAVLDPDVIRAKDRVQSALGKVVYALEDLSEAKEEMYRLIENVTKRESKNSLNMKGVRSPKDLGL